MDLCKDVLFLGPEPPEARALARAPRVGLLQRGARGGAGARRPVPRGALAKDEEEQGKKELKRAISIHQSFRNHINSYQFIHI